MARYGSGSADAWVLEWCGLGRGVGCGQALVFCFSLGVGGAPVVLPSWSRSLSMGGLAWCVAAASAPPRRFICASGVRDGVGGLRFLLVLPGAYLRVWFASGIHFI